jgi:hypothetical protein
MVEIIDTNSKVGVDAFTKVQINLNESLSEAYKTWTESSTEE